MNIEGEDVDLAAELEAALDAGKPQTEAPVEGETQEQAEAREYVREGRRFVPKPKEETAATAPAEGAKPADTPAAPAKPAWKPTWYKDDYGPWEQLAEPLRNALRDQERNAAQAIEKHSTSAKAWEPLTKALEPHMAVLQQAGYTPQSYYNELHEFNVNFRTAKDPVTQIDMLDRLAESVGLDLVRVGEWLATNGKAPQPDPAIAALQRKIAELEGQFTQSRTSGEEAAKAQTQKEIADWSKDKPDFAAVRPYMAALAKQNPDASLDQLYEQARYAHPETRDRILKEIEDKRLADLKGKKAAGATSPRAGFNGEAARSYKNMTLEEEIAANL